MPTSTLRVLRIITIGAFLPAFGLLLAHGLLSGSVFPAVGLVPFAGSALLSAYLLYRDRRTTGGSATTSIYVRLAHTLFAAGLLATLIPSWISLRGHRGYYWGDDSQIIVGAYGTVLMLLVFGIEVFCALKGLKVLIDDQHECPRCKNPLQGHGHSYSAIRDDEEEDEVLPLNDVDENAVEKGKDAIRDDDMGII